MQWKIKEYIDWIVEGCPVNSEVTILNISYSNLKIITPNIKNLVNLNEFYCSHNHLVVLPSEIGHLVNLRVLICSNNRLVDFPPEIWQLANLNNFVCFKNQLSVLPPEIGKLVNLHTFYCANNQLTVLPPEIGKLVNLHTFDCSHNQLTVLPPEIGQLVNLHTFYCTSNRINAIPSEIGQLVNLHEFYCYNNRLVILPHEMVHLENLHTFYCSSNRLTALIPELGQLVNLHTFNCYDNPIEYIPPNVGRLIDRVNHAQGIYNDRQSIHNSSIQESVKISIIKLLAIKPLVTGFEPITEMILEDQTLTDFTKESLHEYSKDETVHSILNITFAELLIVVWNRIISNPHSAEIKAVLNQEMKDASCMCFTGRISRLVNCLSGFDELVNVKISDSEQIGNVIATIKYQLEIVENYSVEEHKRRSIIQLTELGYSNATIQEWVGFIV